MRQLPKTKILVAALCLALVSAFLVYKYLANQAEAARSEVQVVTARTVIPSGTVIKSDMLVLGNVPKNVIEPRTVIDPDVCIGKVTMKQVRSGSPITMSELASNDRLSYTVPQYMRAVTVAIDPVVGVAGFIKPGDHVDVIATFTVDKGTITKTILQNVQLLATGSKTISSAENIQTKTSGTQTTEIPNATLAVQPFDAEKLILADSKGKIRLALRRADDYSIVRSKGLTGRAVLGIVPSDVPEKEEAVQQTSAANDTSIGASLKEFASILSKMIQKDAPVSTAQNIQKVANKTTVKEHTETQNQKLHKIQVIKGTSTEDVVVPE